VSKTAKYKKLNEQLNKLEKRIDELEAEKAVAAAIEKSEERKDS